MMGAQAWVQMKAPLKFTASTRCHAASDVCRIGLKIAMPALFTSASMRPNCAAIFFIAALTCFASATSQCSASRREDAANRLSVTRSVRRSTSSSATR